MTLTYLQTGSALMYSPMVAACAAYLVALLLAAMAAVAAEGR